MFCGKVLCLQSRLAAESLSPSSLNLCLCGGWSCSSPGAFLIGCCLQVLELICTRESGAVFEAGGLNCVLSFIRDSGHLVHKDTLHSAMAVVSRLCSKMEPQDSSLETCVESLSSLLKHEDHQVTR